MDLFFLLFFRSVKENSERAEQTHTERGGDSKIIRVRKKKKKQDTTVTKEKKREKEVFKSLSSKKRRKKMSPPSPPSSSLPPRYDQLSLRGQALTNQNAELLHCERIGEMR